MNEEQFDDDFVWFEWSFVSPDEVPPDENRSSREYESAVRVKTRYEPTDG